MGPVLTNLPNSKALGLVVSDKKSFSCFPYISLCITCDPGGWASFCPMDRILINMIDVSLAMLHIKYQGYTPCDFRQDDFFMFSLYSQSNTFDPQCGACFDLRDII